MPCLRLLKSWRFWIRVLILLFYVLIITVILPILLVKAIKDGFKKRFYMIPIIGGVFVIMTLPIAFQLIIQHMLYYSKPKLQKHIIRVLWMVPIYSLNAWFCLLYPDTVVFFNSFRECYEAYVIYSFMRFLFNYLHERYENFEEKIRDKPQVPHIFPLCFMREWKMGKDLIHKCKHGILQYTVIRPLTTVIILLCNFSADQTKIAVGFICTMIINNISQFVAMYSLVLFYWATKEELAPMKPVGKFMCIKAVIFFSFFQSVIINILVQIGILQPVLEVSNLNIETNEYGDIANFIQNFLLCFEMFLAAIGHHYSFTVEPYTNVICTPKSWKEALYAFWDFSDVGADIKEHLGVVGTSLKRHIKNKNNSGIISPIGCVNNSVKDELSPLLVSNFKQIDDRSSLHQSTSVISNPDISHGIC
ncbi:hypothetical protein PGB90_008294 [Kerria lacca]